MAARAKGSLSLSLRGLNDQEVVARPKPKAPAEDPLEKRWKLEEERRKALERELEELKAALAKKAAEPPPPAGSQPAAALASRPSIGGSARSTASASTRRG